MSVPTQEVRTEQPSASAVECGPRPPVNDRGPYLGMSLLQCRHRSQDIALPEAVDSQMAIASSQIKAASPAAPLRVKHFWGILLFFPCIVI